MSREEREHLKFDMNRGGSGGRSKLWRNPNPLLPIVSHILLCVQWRVTPDWGGCTFEDVIDRRAVENESTHQSWETARSWTRVQWVTAFAFRGGIRSLGPGSCGAHKACAYLNSCRSPRSETCHLSSRAASWRTGSYCYDIMSESPSSLMYCVISWGGMHERVEGKQEVSETEDKELNLCTGVIYI